MTDAELIAKVRADAEDALARRVTSQQPERLARAALALVEQWEWHRSEEESCTMTAAQHLRNAKSAFGVAARSTYAERYSCMAGTHSESAARILASLRKAVG